MSGIDIPYHLRPNKFVERQLFFELLEYVGKYNSLKDYAYISMGGRFLEDFRVVHNRFSIEKLFSIEKEEWVHRRQNFNKPISLIKCLNLDSSQFVTEFSEWVNKEKLENKNFIIWLDYTKPSSLGKHLSELSSIVRQLSKNTIVKITLNCSISAFLAKHTDITNEKYYSEVYDKLKRHIPSALFPPNYDSVEKINSETFQQFILAAIKRAALNGMESKPDCVLRPLSKFIYRDSERHTMLTLTAIILEDSASRSFARTSCIKDWDFYNPGWTKVQKIDIPDMSLRERYAINKHLFSRKYGEIHKSLEFKFADEGSDSFQLMKNYVKYYKQYPSFIRADI